MTYLIAFVSFFILELIYFRIANNFNIIDRPNHRSSHTSVILRGGGIVLVFSIIGWFIRSQYSYVWFTLAIIIISIISFFDDIKPLSGKLRIAVQTISVLLVLYQLQRFSFPLYWNMLALIAILAIVNISNFMDGINGMLAIYLYVALLTSYLLNSQLRLFDDDLIFFIGIGNTVFSFFNCRKKPTCFSGDIGSITMGLILSFFIAGFTIKTDSPIFLLMFAVYGVDGILTILQRMINKENIFKAHRQHLFQYLCNEYKLPHLLVSSIYGGVQMLINIGVVLLWNASFFTQWSYFFLIIFIIGVTYIIIKRRLLSVINTKMATT